MRQEFRSSYDSRGDTGWIGLTLGANVADQGFGWAPGQARRIGTLIHVRGLVVLTAGIAAGATVATIPTTVINGNLAYIQSPFPDVMGASGDPLAGFRIDQNQNRTITTKLALGAGAFVRLFGVVYVD